MIKDLALDLTRVTEAAALASCKWIGTGKKEMADDAAVRAMRHILNSTKIDGEIVIGEGEIDEAPMLYIGEKVGLGGEHVDIAVDPIDGTRMVALGQSEAVAVMVWAQRNSLFKAPDMYMEKIMVNYQAREAIDINLSLSDNIKNVAQALNKPITEMTVMTLFKPRHEKEIKNLQAMGVKVVAIPDGDVAGSVLVAMPEAGIDMFYGIGGAPEGVISAAILKAMNGNMQARLITRSECKGSCEENDRFTQMELDKCQALNLNVGEKITLDKLVNTDDVLISITGITDGQLLSGCKIKDGLGKTETLLIRGRSRTVRRINSTHYLDRKDDVIKEIMDEPSI